MALGDTNSTIITPLPHVRHIQMFGRAYQNTLPPLSGSFLPAIAPLAIE